MYTLFIWLESDESTLLNGGTDELIRQKKCGTIRRAKSVDVSESDSVSDTVFVSEGI